MFPECVAFHLAPQCCLEVCLQHPAPHACLLGCKGCSTVAMGPTSLGCPCSTQCLPDAVMRSASSIQLPLLSFLGARVVALLPQAPTSLGYPWSMQCFNWLPSVILMFASSIRTPLLPSSGTRVVALAMGPHLVRLFLEHAVFHLALCCCFKVRPGSDHSVFLYIALHAVPSGMSFHIYSVHWGLCVVDDVSCGYTYILQGKVRAAELSLAFRAQCCLYLPN